ncbi:MAG: SMP-30/gluconolactonase/LRE family protein [Anaerolineae bacterium]
MAQSNQPTVEVVLANLDNPRGVVVRADGALVVAEAGTGYDAVDPTEMTGKLTLFVDQNEDGDFDDAGEADRWFSHFPTYNALQFFGTGRDEVNGPGDLLQHPDGRFYLTVDGGLDKIALYEISTDGRIGHTLADRSNMNGIAFAPDLEHIYMVESTGNRLAEVTLDGAYRAIIDFPALAHKQQAVPAGVAVDPRTGEVLVALFSGTAVSTNNQTIPLIRGDAKVVRVNPETGEMVDEVVGLTAVVDIATDEAGNLVVLEMTANHADPLPRLYDLFDPDAEPIHGGYLRYSGQVTVYPAGGQSPRTIATGLDMPTNVTVGPDGAWYISTGQGTPGRPIPGPDGATIITGQVVRISNYLQSDP